MGETRGDIIRNVQVYIKSVVNVVNLDEGGEVTHSHMSTLLKSSISIS